MVTSFNAPHREEDGAVQMNELWTDERMNRPMEHQHHTLTSSESRFNDQAELHMNNNTGNQQIQQ